MLPTATGYGSVFMICPSLNSALFHSDGVRRVFFFTLLAVWIESVNPVLRFTEIRDWLCLSAPSTTLPRLILLSGAQHFNGFHAKHLHLKQNFDRLGFVMACATKGYKVFKAVCLLVVFVTARNISEGYKRLLMMYIKLFTVLSLCDSAMLAGVVISLSCCGSLLIPVVTIIALVAAPPRVAVCAGFVFRNPRATAFEATVKMVAPLQFRRRNHYSLFTIPTLHRELFSSAWMRNKLPLGVLRLPCLEYVGALLRTKVVFIAALNSAALNIYRFAALGTSSIKSFLSPSRMCFFWLFRLPLSLANKVAKVILPLSGVVPVNYSATVTTNLCRHGFVPAKSPFVPRASAEQRGNLIISRNACLPKQFDKVIISYAT